MLNIITRKCRTYSDGTRDVSYGVTNLDENKSLYVVGNHKTVEQNESLDSIQIDSYIYQKI